MRSALLTLLLSAPSLIMAQKPPQLTWQAYIHGGAVLFIQGDRVDVQGRETGSVDRPRFTLRTPLPAAAQTIQMKVVRGRGKAEIVEQPESGNEFTAAVKIDPLGGRGEVFQLEFSWDEKPGEQSPRADPKLGTREPGQEKSGEMTWSGSVDRDAMIEVRGRRAIARSTKGRAVLKPNATFSAAVPQREDVNLRLELVGGRGAIELVERPSAKNNYAAVIRIVDPHAGSDRYTFRLIWKD